MWYVRSGEKNLGPYPEAQLREFIAAGRLPPETFILRQGTEQWLRVKDSPLSQPLAVAEDAAPANPFDFLNNSSTASTPQIQVKDPAREQLQNPYWTDFAGQPTVPAINSANHNLSYGYRSPETLKTILLVMAGILAIVHVLAIIMYYSQIDLLTKFQQGFYLNNEAQAQADANAHDAQLMVVGISQLGLTLVYAIIFLFWTYRVKANTWALGARGMTITPGWGVGWYFVPFMNLVRPYQSMQETWKASLAPGDWQRQPGSSLVGFWWFFWISSSILGRISMQISKHANDIDSMLSGTYFDFITEFYDFLPLIAVTMMVIRISNMQVQLSLTSESGTRNIYES